MPKSRNGGLNRYSKVLLLIYVSSNTIGQAFVVTSGIVLALDIFHRSEGDIEIRDYLSWIEKTITLLEKWPSSSIATHGVRLLKSLVQEYNKKIGAATNSNLPNATTTLPSFPDNIAPASLARAAGETEQDESAFTPESMQGWTVPNGDVEMLSFEDIMGNLPMDAGLDNNMFFESMLSLANSQFF